MGKLQDFLFKAAGHCDNGICDAISPDDGERYTRKELLQAISAKNLSYINAGRNVIMVIDGDQKNTEKPVNFMASRYISDHTQNFKIIVGDALLLNETRVLDYGDIIL